MSKDSTSGYLVYGLLLKEVMPLFFPRSKARGKLGFGHILHLIRQLQQLPTSHKLLIISGFAPDYGHHMKLAHLDFVVSKDLEKLLQSINNDTFITIRKIVFTISKIIFPLI